MTIDATRADRELAARVRAELADLDPLRLKLASISDRPGTWVELTERECERLGLLDETALDAGDLDDTPEVAPGANAPLLAREDDGGEED